MLTAVERQTNDVTIRTNTLLCDHHSHKGTTVEMHFSKQNVLQRQ